MDHEIKIGNSKAGHPIGLALKGAIGLLLLVVFVIVGKHCKVSFHLTLPGPVIGLALLAGILLAAERFHPFFHRQLSEHVGPVGRLLVAHMGLLFVPAGVGIITEGERLRHEWLPVVVAMAGSIFLSMLATGWLMQRFAPKQRKP